MRVHYVSPWKDGDIGGGLNEAVAMLPADAWICVRDGDSMFLTPDWGRKIEAIIDAHGDAFAVIGCMTNRLRATYQLHGGRLSHEPDIGRHVAIAEARWAEFGTQVKPAPSPIAAMCMLFRRSVWSRFPFRERDICFDVHFSRAVVASGGRLGVALGLYVFHLYRWGAKDPANEWRHLA